MLPQEPWCALNPLMRAGTQVSETHRLVAGETLQAARTATKQDFSTLSLSGSEQKLSGALSGGMAQRVAFAAARAGGAPLLIADEPTKGLDANIAISVTKILTRVPAVGGTLVAITHDVNVARRLEGEVLIIRLGQLVEQGPTAKVLANPSSDYGKALVAADPSSWRPLPPNPPGDEVLNTRDLTVARGARILLEALNLSLSAGERLAVTGPSGSGKTSLLDTLAGLQAPLKGTVSRGLTVGRHGVQKIYQDPPSAFPPRIILGRNLRDVTERHNAPWSAAQRLLNELGIEAPLLDRRPDEVSGGELQRIALVRAMCISPAILLADEPTSRLDPITQAETMSLIARTAAEKQIAVVLVTHDKIIAERWANRRLSLTNPRSLHG